MNNYSTSFTMGGVLLAIGVATFFIGSSEDDYLLITLSWLMIIFGFSFIVYGLLGMVRGRKIETVYKPLKNCLWGRFWEDVDRERKRRPMGKSQNVCISELWHEFRQLDRNNMEEKLLWSDMDKLLTMTIKYTQDHDDAVNIAGFHKAMLKAIVYKIDHPIKNYRGANYYLKNVVKA